MSRLIYRPSASADIQAAFEWYESQRPDLGDEFLERLGRPAQVLESRQKPGKRVWCGYGRSVNYLSSRRVAASALLAMVLAGCNGGAAEPAAVPNSPLSQASPPSDASASPSPSPSPEPSPIAVVDGASAGRALAEAEAGIRSAGTSPERVAKLARTQQVTYRTLVANPAWQGDALAQLPPELVPVAQANIDAGAALRALTKPGEKLPAWRIIDPPPAGQLLSHYKQAEAEFGVPWQYLASIHLVESRMGRIRGTSTAGAQGPMQFIPPTWAAYGRGDIDNPLDAILAAGRYLKASGAPGNMPKALFAYNRSDRYVNAITLYAQQMMQDERAYLGYYNWQVFYRLPTGDVELEVGYVG